MCLSLSIYIVTNEEILFSRGCVSSASVHPLTDTYKTFHVLATLNNALVSAEISEIEILFPFDIYLELGLLDHMVVQLLIF